MIDERLKGSSVLIVDDNPANLSVLFDHLYEAGFKALVAEDGESAIRQTDLVKPDIILLDVMMPGVDGFETCRRIKKNNATKDIPVIFMTALSDTGDKVRGFKMGAVDYIIKPFQKEEVLARINAHLTIQNQKQELNDLNATKDKFFSIIAHDLRNPFNGLIGASDLLIRSFENLEKEIIIELIRNINTASRNAFALLNNLLEWSRTQTGKIKWEPSKINLHRITNDILQLLKQSALEKKINMVNTFKEDCFAYADRDMINTVMRNLMTNALKYTNTGGIITVSSQDSENFIEISVSDTGVGIEEQDMEKLFRIDSHHTTPGTANEKGTGLGLILCKEFVEKNRGTLRAESKAGQGTTFYFTLPKSSEN